MRSHEFGPSNYEASDSAASHIGGPPLTRIASPAPGGGVSAESSEGSAVGTKHRRRWLYFFASISLILVIAAVGGGYWGYERVQQAMSTYQQVKLDVRALESLKSANFAAFNVTDAQRAHGQFVQLQTDVNHLDEQTTLPSFVEPIALRIPYLKRRYTAGRQVIQVARLLADSGVVGSAIGEQALQAYKTTGLSAPSSPSSPTWLDVVNQQMPQIVAVKNQIDQAIQLRSKIDVSVLPASTSSHLDQLDKLVASHDLNKLVDTQLPALISAFGGDEPARYLVLIQNPSELRPSGGFPGTIAIVTFERGQLRNYEFYDVYDLNLAYTSNPHDPVTQPWALSKYAPSPELSILDASWWSDFPASAQTIMQMYQATGWPSIKGVVALDPAAVGAMLRLSGPMTIDVDGEMRTITADNVHDEIERQRRLARDGQKSQDVHKQVVAIIGKNLIEELKSGDRSMTLKMVTAIEQTATDRDLQVYSADPTVQALIKKRQWAGRLVPDAAEPTIAVTFANVAFGKSSELMYPSYTLTFGPSTDGEREAHLAIMMQHTGSLDDDPFYSGFQRWWVDVTLPAGSQRTGSSFPDVSNPEEPNGGSYEIPLMPASTETLKIDFVMPDSATLTFRRQPGLHTALVKVVDQACGVSSSPRYLTSDGKFQLSSICATP